MDKYDSISLAQPKRYYTILQSLSDEKIHTHNFWELVLQVKGASWNMVNNHTYTLQAGDVLFMKPDDTHQIIYQNGALVRDIYIQNEQFSKITRCLNYDFFPESQCDKPLLFSLDPSAVATLENAYMIFDLYPTQTSVMDDIHNSLACFILGQYVANTLYSHQKMPTWMKELIQNLSTCEFIDEPIDILVKRLTNYSYGHVVREFKKYSSLTLAQYITQIKMERALNLLQKTSDNLDIIANKIGFKSATGFINAFSRYYKITPHQYRMKYLQS